jgi:DNA-binding NarL/FixJ family response regulator
MIRLLLADDHQIFRQGARRLLSDHDDFTVVAEAANYAEVLNALREFRIDVAILDITMPGRNGIELLTHIKSRHPEVRTLVLTMHAAEPYVTQALRAGADGYMTKEHAVDDLAMAIRRVAAGGRCLSPDIAERLALNVALHPGEEASHTRLSSREYRVFEMLVNGKRGSEIAQELSVSEKTVSTHKMKVLQKMNVETTSDLVRYAVRNGLVPP